jgi:CubicO group peptidase (beta-lactamase class C family)
VCTPFRLPPFPFPYPFLYPNWNTTARASGIFGQGIYINPSEDVVIAMHSARALASDPDESDLQIALYGALTEVLEA